MTTQNWQHIWNKRRTDRQVLTLEDLISLDGFDSGAGKITVNAWRQYANTLADKMSLQHGESVFEVGCGSAALLLALREVKAITVAGIDYSAPLINAARQAIPEADFVCEDARHLNPHPSYDHVVANSVFQYFPLDEAEKILRTMIQKSNKNIFILDIPSLDKREESESTRKASLTDAEYEEKYRGLPHTYYSESWFLHLCETDSTSCTFAYGLIPGYMQNSYRFNCLISKNKTHTESI